MASRSRSFSSHRESKAECTACWTVRVYWLAPSPSLSPPFLFNVQYSSTRGSPTGAASQLFSAVAAFARKEIGSALPVSHHLLRAGVYLEAQSTARWIARPLDGSDLGFPPAAATLLRSLRSMVIVRWADDFIVGLPRSRPQSGRRHTPDFASGGRRSADSSAYFANRSRRSARNCSASPRCKSDRRSGQTAAAIN